VAALLLTASLAVPAAEPVFPPGHYLLTAQLVMPHLEEMRRMSTHGEQCLSGTTPEALFPVLRQPALRGCRFTDGKRAGTRNEYVFACASARVASGHMALTHAPERDRVTALLEVKMGGKNMTFSQRVVARRDGDCRSGEVADRVTDQEEMAGIFTRPPDQDPGRP